MLTTLSGVLFLAFFTLMPLQWVEMGAPWASIAVAFVAIPLIDALVGHPRRDAAQPRPIPFVRWIPRLQLPLQAALLIGAVRVAPELPMGQLMVFAFAVGTVTGGMGITIAHELGHRASRLDRAIAKALLVSVAYGHFFVEHVRGHHVRVATADDPATAPRGMSVYRFVVRSVIGSFAHALRLEQMRLHRSGRSAWHPSNWVLTGSLLSVVLLGAAWWMAGPSGALLFALQAVWALVLLEIINYVEHYGLQRRRIDGRYEPVREEHSWNADFTVSNWVLFNLQLHSDHHAHMNRPFEQLRTVADAPQLPAGYPAMVLLALVPPLWFAVMDPRLPARA
ncbi:MAG: alkane 1-monooxygenase [Burkholderiaceae bacterium]